VPDDDPSAQFDVYDRPSWQEDSQVIRTVTVGDLLVGEGDPEAMKQFPFDLHGTMALPDGSRLQVNIEWTDQLRVSFDSPDYKGNAETDLSHFFPGGEVLYPLEMGGGMKVVELRRQMRMKCLSGMRRVANNSG